MAKFDAKMTEKMPMIMLTSGFKMPVKISLTTGMEMLAKMLMKMAHERQIKKCFQNDHIVLAYYSKV